MGEVFWERSTRVQSGLVLHNSNSSEDLAGLAFRVLYHGRNSGKSVVVFLSVELPSAASFPGLASIH